MESRRGKWRDELIYTIFMTSLVLFFLFALSSPCAAAKPVATEMSSGGSSSSADCYSQISTATRTRRQLRAGGGPGSYPPRCTGKCGSCAPCFPVHVPVPPGTPVTTEYYPEAWRCKCGNRLFMP